MAKKAKSKDFWKTAKGKRALVMFQKAMVAADKATAKSWRKGYSGIFARV